MQSMFRSPKDVSSSAESQENVTSDESHVSGRKMTEKLQAGLNTGGNQEANVKEQENDKFSDSGPLAQRHSASLMSLPGLLPHQHHSLLHLSLLDDKCRSMAAKHLNSTRQPQDYLREDHPDVVSLGAQIYSTMPKDHIDYTGLPRELIGPEGAPVRNAYSSGFEDMVNNAAVRALRGLDAQPSSTSKAGTFPGFGVMSLDGTIAAGSSAPAIMSGANRSPFKYESAYANEYHEISKLGKGGYGQVFKVRNHLDKQEYAIKKIVISSQRVRKFLEKDQVDGLLAEVQTLAKLHHRNIVRYHHAWVEYTPSATHVTSATEFEDTTGGQLMLTGPEDSESSSQSGYNYSLGMEELQHTVGCEGNQGMVQEYETAMDHQEYDDAVVFEYSLPQQSRSDHERSGRIRRASRATTTSTITHQTSVLSMAEDDDDPEIEDIPRASEEIGVVPSIATSSAIRSGSGRLGVPELIGPDITLYIKMSLHPMTLHTYLSSEASNQDSPPPIRHCFHQKPSVAILGAVLNGIEYLHSQRIVHRDIKPANIFLSVHEDKAPSSKGCVDIMQCRDCGNFDSDKRIYLTPCLGDFGLIAEIKEAMPENPESDSNTPPIFRPSPLAALQHKPVGTPFYRPITMPKNEPIICPKLDVYSLGIISLEMIHRFGTKSERVIILDALKKGNMPKGFEDHAMAGGIKSMSCEDRDSRWDLEAVRQWLEQMAGDGKERE